MVRDLQMAFGDGDVGGEGTAKERQFQSSFPLLCPIFCYFLLWEEVSVGRKIQFSKPEFKALFVQNESIPPTCSS